MDNNTGNCIYDLPQNFRTYAEKEGLHCLRRQRTSDFGFLKWVFWTQHLPLQVPIADSDIVEKKIKHLLQTLILPGQVLIQFWKATEGGGRRLLSARDQPFGLSTAHEGLCSYRLISLNYKFHVDGECEEEQLGLPGRVFRHHRLESTPNVKYYSSKEYPQRDRALACNVMISWAVPVFDPSGSGCVGVLELLTPEANGFYTSSAFQNYISSKLGLVHLKCLQPCHELYEEIEDNDGALRNALEEIKQVLEVVCRTHQLPLAQTWVLCKLCNSVVMTGSADGSCRESLVSRAACIVEEQKLSFLDACASHHLEKGQGVVGRAFLSHNLVYCKDISQFSIADYPLAHYARHHGLTGCFAICLRSIYTGDDVYVLEFFLPPRDVEGWDLRTYLGSLFETLNQHLQSFNPFFGEQLGKQLYAEVIDISKDVKLNSFQMFQIAKSPDGPKTLVNGREKVLPHSSVKRLVEVDATPAIDDFVSTKEKDNIAITSSLQKCVINSSKRQHRKAATPDLKQHSGMKLEDAAASLGVSQSTFQRSETRNDKHSPRSKTRNDKHSPPNKSVRNATQQEQIRNTNQSPVPASKPGMPLQVTGIITIKAKYGDAFIKFQIPVGSGMVEFEEQVMKRLNLRSGTYKVKYQDADNDWILMACDEDLQDCISNSISQGRNTVTVLLQPMC